jgi:DNA-directed RNA polymerase
MDLFRINGYILHQKFRADGNGGGVAIYVKTNGNFIVNRVFEETNLELLCLEVKQTNCKSFLIACVYRSANRDECFWEDFENFLNYFSKKEVIILGDFNIDFLNPINKSWLRSMKDKNLTQLIKCPTRISQTSSSCIDHIYSNKIKNISSSGVLDINLSDHKAIYVSRKLNFMKKYRKDSQHFEIKYSF